MIGAIPLAVVSAVWHAQLEMARTTGLQNLALGYAALAQQVYVPKRHMLVASKCLSCGAPLFAMKCDYCGGYHRMEGERP